MTIDIMIKQTHNYIYSHSPIEIGFKIYITPLKTAINRGTHYIIMIDNSPSMQGEKLNIAIQSAKKLLSELPEGNFVTLITFSNHPEIKYQGPSGLHIDFNAGKGYTTRFYEAINFSMNLASQSQFPTKIIVLTDGKPTDKRNVKDYEKLEISQNTQIITIGIGKDYNEKILKKLADKSSGNFYHIEKINDLPNIFEKEKATSVFGYNLQLQVPQGFVPFNYDLPIRIPIIDKLLVVYGTLTIPAGKDPYVISFTANYTDPINEQQKTLTKSVTLQRADGQVVDSYIDKDLVSEIKYYRTLREYADTLYSGQDATKVLNELRKISEETKRPDLIEETRKLGSDSKTDLSEVTRKMRS
ncbi:MAG: VWA domain-containing protein [Saccharolobus sp.]